jgi:hypothetical protein
VPCSDGNIQCDLEPLTTQTGAACLVLSLDRHWTMDATVAIVENLECFLHFAEMGVTADAVLYASGRLSALALTWLSSAGMSRCRFTHCGDYDPVGLAEFLRLEKAVGDRATLHIPHNLEQLVRTYGRPELLRDSTTLLNRLRSSTHPDVQHVIRILDTTGCGLDQEALLLDSAITPSQTPIARA